MSFEDYIDAPDCAFLFYVTISGLPWVWLSGECPSEWLTAGYIVIDGENYAPCPTLVLGDEVELEELVEPWAGVGETHELQFAIQMTGLNRGVAATEVSSSLVDTADPGLALLSSALSRGVTAVHVEDDIGAATTSIKVDVIGNFSAGGGTVHRGIEAMSYTGKNAGRRELTGLTRGLFGSMARAARASLEWVEESGEGGAYVSDHPTAMAGRVVSLWVAPGRLVDGEFVPYSDAAADDTKHDWLAFRGFVAAPAPIPSLLEMTITAQSLEGIMEYEVGHRLPKHMAGMPAHAWHRFYVGPDNWRIKWSWGLVNRSTSTQNYDEPRDEILQYGGSDITEGFYSLSEIQSAINETMATGTWGSDFTYGLITTDNDDGAPVISLVVGVYDASRTDENALTIIPSAGTIWQELGWTEMVITPETDEGSDYYSWTVEASRPLPALRIPAESTSRWIPYVQQSGQAFNLATGFLDDGGDQVPTFVQLGDEIFEVDADSTTTVGGQTIRYLRISRRGRYGSERYEHYVEKSPDLDREALNLKQVLGFPRTSYLRAMLYAICSGSGESSNGTYDQGWYDVGAYMDQNLVDIDQFELVSGLVDSKRDVCITEPITIADLFRGDLVATQVSVYSADGQLTCGVYELPNEAAASDAVELDHDCIITRAGIGFEIAESRIVNVIKATEVGYDHATGDSAENVTHRQGTSIKNWGAATPLELSMRNWSAAGQQETRAAIVDLANRMYALFSRPFPVTEFAISRAAKCWTVPLHALAALTHQAIPDTQAAEWGVSGILGRVLGRRLRIKHLSEDAIRGYLILALYGFRGDRLSEFCPTAYCTSITGGTRLVCTQHRFSNDDDPRTDPQYFKVGYQVRIYETGNESTAVNKQVNLVGTGHLDVSSTVYLTPPLVIEFAGYGTASYHEDQYKHCHFASNRVLTRNGGQQDPCFEYS